MAPETLSLSFKAIHYFKHPWKDSPEQKEIAFLSLQDI